MWEFFETEPRRLRQGKAEELKARSASNLRLRTLYILRDLSMTAQLSAKVLCGKEILGHNSFFKPRALCLEERAGRSM
jgi:hypothetical protein